MGRANRLTVRGGIFHVTHRCHNRSFLLKFARDREAYRTKLREGLNEYALSLFDYTVTSNHVHLLLEAERKSEVSAFMQKVAGEFARNYNRRKDRSNAFWGDNFHATLVEDGRYLFECLLYVELNMVRCGVARHPRDWPWGGYHEIMGSRQRYRLLDLERLCWRLGTSSLEELRRQIEFGITERIAQGAIKRMEYWTRALGVGSQEFLEKSQGLIFTRLETKIVEQPDGMYVLQEAPEPCSQKRASKSAFKVDYRLKI